MPLLPLHLDAISMPGRPHVVATGGVPVKAYLTLRCRWPCMLLQMRANLPAESIEGLLERGDEVVGVLEATRDAHEPVGDAHLQTILLEHVRVRHEIGRAHV